MTAADAGPQPNRIAPAREDGRASRRIGDVPATVLSRYLVEREGLERRLAFYRDARERAPRFIDHGGRLSAPEAYPDAVRDMLRIARHRGWAAVRVEGAAAFRREVWLQGRALGMEVHGHRPSPRDRQAAGEPLPSPGRTDARTAERLERAMIVVRGLVRDPAARDRLLDHALRRAMDRSRDPDRPRERTR